MGRIQFSPSSNPVLFSPLLSSFFKKILFNAYDYRVPMENEITLPYTKCGNIFVCIEREAFNNWVTRNADAIFLAELFFFPNINHKL